MNTSILPKRIAILLGGPLCFWFAGCYHYVPMEVELLDADSGRPCAGASVHIEYGRVLEFFPPDMKPVISDKDGRAVLRAAIDYPKRNFPAPAYFYFKPFQRDDSGGISWEELPMRDLQEEYQRQQDGVLPQRPVQMKLKVLSPESWMRKYPRSGQ